MLSNPVLCAANIICLPKVKWLANLCIVLMALQKVGNFLRILVFWDVPMCGGQFNTSWCLETPLHHCLKGCQVIGPTNPTSQKTRILNISTVETSNCTVNFLTRVTTIVFHSTNEWSRSFIQHPAQYNTMEQSASLCHS